MQGITIKHIRDFVKEFKKSKNGFDAHDISNLREILDAAIEKFEIKANIGFDEEDEYEYIELYQMSDEELLNNVLKTAVNDGIDCTVWYLFEGNLLRKY